MIIHMVEVARECGHFLGEELVHVGWLLSLEEEETMLVQTIMNAGECLGII